MNNPKAIPIFKGPDEILFHNRNKERGNKTMVTATITVCDHALEKENFIYEVHLKTFLMLFAVSASGVKTLGMRSRP